MSLCRVVLEYFSSIHYSKWWTRRFRGGCQAVKNGFPLNHRIITQWGPIWMNRNGMEWKCVSKCVGITNLHLDPQPGNPKSPVVGLNHVGLSYIPPTHAECRWISATSDNVPQLMDRLIPEAPRTILLNKSPDSVSNTTSWTSRLFCAAIKINAKEMTHFNDKVGFPSGICKYYVSLPVSTHLQEKSPPLGPGGLLRIPGLFSMSPGSRKKWKLIYFEWKARRFSINSKKVLVIEFPSDITFCHFPTRSLHKSHSKQFRVIFLPPENSLNQIFWARSPETRISTMYVCVYVGHPVSLCTNVMRQ